MDSKHRRDFLKLCVASIPALVFTNGLSAKETKGRGVAQPAYRTPDSLERYIDPLPIPKQLKPYSTSKDKDQYRVRMLQFKRQMHSQLPPTRLWGYEGQYPGPTIEALRGRPIEVRWENNLPRWDLGLNPNRVQRLRHAVNDRQLFPLDQLITMHAGDVVGMRGGKIAAFYAQDWAFAVFLLHGDHGRHRPALEKLLTDTANGTAYLPGELPHSVLPDAWQPQSVKPLLERYLGEDLATVDREYQAYIRAITSGEDPTTDAP